MRREKNEHKGGGMNRRAIFSLTGKRIKNVHTIRSRFGLVVCTLFGAAGLITTVIFYILGSFDFFDSIFTNGTILVGAMALTWITIGVGITAATQRIWFGRVMRISEGLREIANGNFKTRVPEKDKKEVITELGELERTFNRMAADLDGIEMFRSDFINNFSHEFKTPIVSIRGFARRLQSENLTDDERREYIGIIVSESERLATMAQNVLLLTKLENQTIVSEKSEFYLDEQIRRSILLLEKAWSEKEIDLELELDEVKVIFDEEMLSHVWINLFSNAIKFTPQGGKICCRLYEEGENAVFKIKDNGCGMDDNVRARIFEKFYQGDSSHSTSGNGIGLNIAQRVLTLAKGQISVESVIGEGSEFTVILPIER